MQDITQHAMRVIMQRAPVWACHLAGRTRVFLDHSCPTALVTGGNGRFKIVVNDQLAKGPDLEFLLLHEIAHIFRHDLGSMKKYPSLAQEINVAADCIINDSLIKMGVPVPELAPSICWGKKIYKQDCSEKSINDLIKVELSEKEKQKATAPGNVDEGGNQVEEEEGSGEKDGEPRVGKDPDMSGKVGVGGDPANHHEARKVAQSVAAYARRMFFEQGFKSKNLATKNDWRRNRTAFASRTDVVIPRSTIGGVGNDRTGPLVNLVLDVSGSMNRTWVTTAATIAKEIWNAQLDFDLWLTPVRQKAKDPKQVLDVMLQGGDINYGRAVQHMLHPRSFPDKAHGHGKYDTPEPGGPSNAVGTSNKGSGADELFALRLMETEDPVVWIYIGDYQSTIGFDLHTAPNFLHIPIVGDVGVTGYTEATVDYLDKNGLPRWKYQA